MTCEKCGNRITNVLVDMFDHEGADDFHEMPITACGKSAAYIDTSANWTGYELSEEEMPDTIRCPYCKQYPFVDTEIHVEEVVRVVMFRKQSKRKEDVKLIEWMDERKRRNK